MNRIVLSGNIGKRPESRGSQGNIASFSLAVDVRQKGGEKSTMWCKCVAFGKTGESILKNVDSGSFVALWGKMQQSEWQKDGVKRIDLEIVVDGWEFVGAKPRELEHKAESNPISNQGSASWTGSQDGGSG